MGCAGSKDAGGGGATGGAGGAGGKSAAAPHRLDDGTKALQDLLAGKNVGVDDFELGKIVGEGAYSRVCVAKLKQGSTATFVMKVLRKHDIIKLKQVKKVASEKDVLAMMKSPFVVSLLATFQDEDRLYILLPFVNGGELFDYICAQKKLPVESARCYMAELIEGIMHIHSHQVVYRDMKSENVLIDNRGHLRIVDFGFAKIVNDKTYTLCGSPEYIAPEIIEGKGYALTVDWWALGVLFYKMCIGKFPFQSRKKGESWSTIAFQRVVSEKIEYPDDLDPKVVDAITKFLTKDTARRVGCGKPKAASEGELRKLPFLSTVNWTEVQAQSMAMPYIPDVKDESDLAQFDAKTVNMRRVTSTQGVSVSMVDQELFEGFGPMADNPDDSD